jgi:membrane fusion protein, copper/silver efflux system
MKEKLKFNKRQIVIFLLFTVFSGLLYSCDKARDKSPDKEQVYYCPMCPGQEQHTQGSCKVCKMKLVIKELHTHTEEYYTCPMHPQIKEKKPGICPICGMDLVKKTDQIESPGAEGDPVNNPVNSSVLSKAKSIRPISASMPVFLKMNGYISYDERKFHDVSARYGGRIEKLYVKYAFQPVVKGQPLFEIYSHELRSAQHNYLLIKDDENSKSLIEAAKQKLLLLGMTTAQINQLAKEGHENERIPVYSPYTGYIVEINGESQNSISNKPAMSVMNEAKPSENEQPLLIRQGAYVNKGESVFRIINTDQVWAILELRSDQISLVKTGQAVMIEVENSGKMLKGKVDFIEPVLGKNSESLKVRVYLNNSGKRLKIGNFISATIEAGEKNGIWIPASSVLDLGKEKIVFIRKDGAYKTHIIQTGLMNENEVEVTQGLNTEDEIAENAQYLIDSEDLVKISGNNQ